MQAQKTGRRRNPEAERKGCSKTDGDAPRPPDLIAQEPMPKHHCPSMQ
jgi:hypothetical protein